VYEKQRDGKGNGREQGIGYASEKCSQRKGCTKNRERAKKMAETRLGVRERFPKERGCAHKQRERPVKDSQTILTDSVCMSANEDERRRRCKGRESNCVCVTVEQIYSVPESPMGDLHKPAMKITS
jgi:hypothetical protein